MNGIDYFNESRREEGLPTIAEKWEVCDRCHGEGELGGYPGVYTQSDFAEDPEFFEDYINHRRPCEECRGRTTIKVPDVAGADDETRHAFYAYQRMIWDMEAMERQERAMGA